MIALCLGAVLSAFNLDNPATNRQLMIASALLLLLGVVLTILLNQKTLKQRWYGGRAAAESVKTLAWRYMLCAEPFSHGLPPAAARQLFVQSLREILAESEVLAVALPDSEAMQITDAMDRVRRLALAERKETYLSERVLEQLNWYRSRAEKNATSQSWLFSAVIITQLMAFGAAMSLSVWPEFWINPAGIFATLAASFLAWLQVKQHEELAQSYAVAAHELSLVREAGMLVAHESELSAFVADAETAISREHTLWLARRDQLRKTI